MDDYHESFLCIIHGGLLLNPVVLPCGHSFCADCMNQWLPINPSCPCCREPSSLDEVRVNYNLKEGMQSMLKPTTVDTSDLLHKSLLVRTPKAEILTARLRSNDVVWKCPYYSVDNIDAVRKDVERTFQLFKSIGVTDHIVALYGVTYNPPGLVQERMSSSIEQCFLKEQLFSLSEAELIMEDAAAGLTVLHEKGFVHRDISAGNVMLKIRNGSITAAKIGDIDDSRSNNAVATQAVFGTVAYMAPEVLMGQCIRVSSPVDIFSLGVLFWAILTNNNPSYVVSSAQALQVERVKKQGEALIDLEQLPLQWKPLVYSMVAISPGSRPSAASVLAKVRGNSNPPSEEVIPSAPGVMTLAQAARQFMTAPLSLLFHHL
ncbi:hypothetical protein P9112_011010 [Eukaryota sp. TZLM1-RC]